MCSANTDGGYIVTNESGYLIKTDNTGAELWSCQLSGQGVNAKYVSQTNDGGYIVTGAINYSSPNVLVTKVNSNGTELWSNTISLTSDNGTGIFYGGKMIHQTFDNGYIICADAKGAEIPVGGAEGDVPYYTLIKTDSTGQELWRGNF